MDYNQIVLAAKAYADRNDIEVNANIDNFILLAEAKINRRRDRKDKDNEKQPSGGTIIAIIIFLGGLFLWFTH